MLLKVEDNCPTMSTNNLHNTLYKLRTAGKSEKQHTVMGRHPSMVHQ